MRYTAYEERLNSQFPPGFTVYRVQDRQGFRRGVAVRRPRHWWSRTWQAEWDGAKRAVRAYTRQGAIVKGVRLAEKEGDTDATT